MTTFDAEKPTVPGADPGTGWAMPGVSPDASKRPVQESQPGPADNADRKVPTSPGGAPGAASGTEPGTPGTPSSSTGRKGSDRDITAEVEALRQEGAGGSAVDGVHPILAAVHDCLYALRGAQHANAGSLSVEEITVLLLAVAQIIAQAVALKLKLLVAAETHNVAEQTGATCTAAFHAHLTQTNRPAAAAEVRLAKDLDRRYLRLADAFAAGRLSPDQLTTCVAALRKLPKDLPEDAIVACEDFLIEAAAHHDPRALRNLGRCLWAVIDPDGAEGKEAKDLEEEEELARARAYFTHRRNGDGTTGFRGKLPDAQFDILHKLIQAYAAPRRRSNKNIPTPNPEAGQRRGDGNHGTGPDAPCDQPEAQAHPAEATTGKQLSWPRIMGLGLIDLIEHIPPDAIPYSGGMPASLLVMLRYEQLLADLGAATLDTGTKISPAPARRWACEAGLIPVVLDGESRPLDIGREQRLHTKYQRYAMAAHNQAQGINGCIVEGCDRSLAATVAHHRLPWSEGGDTSLDNGALPCPYHHTLFHHADWTVAWLPNGRARLRRTKRSRN